MKCPFCHKENNEVIRTQKYDTVIMRIRFCRSCNFGFETAEELKANTKYSNKIFVPHPSKIIK